MKDTIPESPHSSIFRVEVYRSSPQKLWTYEQLDHHQRKIAERVQKGEPGTLILSELAPVITLGRRAELAHFLVSQDDLLQKGIEVYPTDRGGLATFHGPGQWVLFPVLSLEELTGDSRGVRALVEQLLQIAYEVGSQYLSRVEVRGGVEQGVWSECGKFAAVGVHIDHGVVLHGLSINGFKVPESFYGIKPCGLDSPVSYLLEQPDEKEFEKLGAEILEAAQRAFFRPKSLINLC